MLATTLFAWIARNRVAEGSPPRALLVIDEAKDFLPTARATPCKESLLKLMRQGRKYGLGVVFATGEPTGIDHAAIASCATQILGKASSPPAIERMRGLLQVRGGKGDDIAQLRPGEFYVSSDGVSMPQKIATPWCLSWHPGTPLDAQEVLQRSRRPG